MDQSFHFFKYCFSVIQRSSQPEKPRVQGAAGHRQQGSPGEPALPVRHLADRKHPDLRTEPGKAGAEDCHRHPGRLDLGFCFGVLLSFIICKDWLFYLWT